ncbi:hypothetical protein CDL15_Pgr005583 [Punica granatum]|uniref:Nucleolin-like n=1 Tax=Punica granatum TaxID=22663 RepID=A0A218WFE9_PUNGR|nr:hypothetical protein CDL15_Pgr005583 [Punica granatum]
MAKTRSEEEELSLPAKRKPDLTCSNPDEAPPAKTPKSVDAINGVSHADSGAETVQAEENGAGRAEVPDASGRSGADLDGGEKEAVQDCEIDEDDEEDDEDYDDEEDGDEDGQQRMVDVKGKGILKDDKGKGKLIVGEDDDGGSDSDDSDDDDPSGSDSDVQSGSDSDWAEDPLAEVDLDNILPSRTRRKRAQSGVVIAGDRGKTDGGNDGSKA